MVFPLIPTSSHTHMLLPANLNIHVEFSQRAIFTLDSVSLHKLLILPRNPCTLPFLHSPFFEKLPTHPSGLSYITVFQDTFLDPISCSQIPFSVYLSNLGIPYTAHIPSWFFKLLQDNNQGFHLDVIIA